MSLHLDPRQRAMLAELGIRVWWPAQAVATATEASGALKIAITNEAGNASTESARGLNQLNDSEPGRTAAAATQKAVIDSRAGSAPAQTGVADSRAAAAVGQTSSVRPAPDSVRQPPARRVAALLPGPASLLPLPDGIASMDWSALGAAVAGCQACHMCLGRQAAVFVAPPAGLRCDWLVLGEPPDDAQERVGQPFVDDAGKLLDNMLKAIGVRRCTTSEALPAASLTDVTAAASGIAPVTSSPVAYLSHVIKCRPARPATPQAAALLACAHYLRREIALLQPKVILAMGRFAMHVLLSEAHPGGLTLPLGKLRGHVWHYQGVPVVVTYPPAYLLRHGHDKASAWADLCLAQDVVQGVASTG